MWARAVRLILFSKTVPEGPLSKPNAHPPSLTKSTASQKADVPLRERGGELNKVLGVSFAFWQKPRTDQKQWICQLWNLVDQVQIRDPPNINCECGWASEGRLESFPWQRWTDSTQRKTIRVGIWSVDGMPFQKVTKTPHTDGGMSEDSRTTATSRATSHEVGGKRSELGRGRLGTRKDAHPHISTWGHPAAGDLPQPPVCCPDLDEFEHRRTEIGLRQELFHSTLSNAATRSTPKYWLTAPNLKHHTHTHTQTPWSDKV